MNLWSSFDGAFIGSSSARRLPMTPLMAELAVDVHGAVVVNNLTYAPRGDDD